MSVLKDDGEDQRSELSYAEPEVAQDASPAPIPSSAPPEESASTTPAPVVAPTVPVPPTPFQQPVSHLSWHSEEHKKKFFDLREEMHLQRTWQKPKNLAVLEALNEAMWKEELDAQRQSIQDFDDDLAAQWKDSPPVSEGYFEERDQAGDDERMVEVEDVTDKAEEPHKVVVLDLSSLHATD